MQTVTILLKKEENSGYTEEYLLEGNIWRKILLYTLTNDI